MTLSELRVAIDEVLEIHQKITDREDDENLVAAWDPLNVTSKANRTRVEFDSPANTLHAAGQSVLGPSVGVRRLTPTECARLMAFPDRWACLCDEEVCVCPDGPQYAAYGNSVVVNVCEWIVDGVTKQ